MTTDTTDPRALGEECLICGRGRKQHDTGTGLLTCRGIAVPTYCPAARQSSSTSEVTQEDRDLAAQFFNAGGPGHKQLAETFARHRHRFASPQTAGGVGELVEKLRKWADSGDMGRSPDPSDLRRKAADTIASLTAERDAALVRCEGLEKLLRDKDMGDA